jgi:hypothetical protein
MIEKKKLLRCRKIVFGDIKYLQANIFTNNIYSGMKVFHAVYFLLAVLLATKFKLSIAMLIIIAKLMSFYLKTYEQFTTSSQEEKLDPKIQMRLRKFY